MRAIPPTNSFLAFRFRRLVVLCAAVVFGDTTLFSENERPPVPGPGEAVILFGEAGILSVNGREPLRRGSWGVVGPIRSTIPRSLSLSPDVGWIVVGSGMVELDLELVQSGASRRIFAVPFSLVDGTTYRLVFSPRPLADRFKTDYVWLEVDGTHARVSPRYAIFWPKQK